MTTISNAKIAILATHGFEQSELTSPREALKEAGASVTVVAPDGGSITGWQGTDWGDPVDVDSRLADCKAADFDALVLPGGVINPDQLRTKEAALQFIRHFVDSGKVIGAICHGPWSLINADAVDGRQMTSFQSIRKDLENAGAQWSDEEVIVDGNLVTSRSPDDLPAFNQRLVEEIRDDRKRRAA